MISLCKIVCKKCRENVKIFTLAYLFEILVLFLPISPLFSYLYYPCLVDTHTHTHCTPRLVSYFVCVCVCVCVCP